MKKLNCWEFKKCGREAGGNLTDTYGVCPASTETRLNGVHGGKNGGRSCCVVAGTLCEGKIQGSFAYKFKGCGLCDFYKFLKEEEKESFIEPTELLEKLK